MLTVCHGQLQAKYMSFQCLLVPTFSSEQLEEKTGGMANPVSCARRSDTEVEMVVVDVIVIDVDV